MSYNEQRENGFTAIAWIVGIILAVAVGVAVYFFGFAVQKDSSDRSTDVNRQTEQYRASIARDFHDKMDAISALDVQVATATDAKQTATVEALKGQQKSYINDLCADVDKLDKANWSSDMVAANTKYCG